MSLNGQSLDFMDTKYVRSCVCVVKLSISISRSSVGSCGVLTKDSYGSQHRNPSSSPCIYKRVIWEHNAVTHKALLAPIQTSYMSTMQEPICYPCIYLRLMGEHKT